jgi:hypothetical protein
MDRGREQKKKKGGRGRESRSMEASGMPALFPGRKMVMGTSNINIHEGSGGHPMHHR